MMCDCGRPDAGMCPRTCKRVSGGHCACMHEPRPIDEAAAVRQWGADA